MIKTFIFNSFYQCPLALTFTFFLMGAQVTKNQSTLAQHSLLSMHVCDGPAQACLVQAYAQPYASNVLDKLQSCAYTAQFIFLFFGLLFATGNLSTMLCISACQGTSLCKHGVVAEKGSNELNELLTYGFFGAFFLMGAACTFVIYNDLRR